MCASSAVVVLIVDVIDLLLLLLLLSFVPRVVLPIDREIGNAFIHLDQELSTVPSLLERPEEAPIEWYG